ncbi:fimbrillin family protein [Prevotella communis]|uniref:fimbrillin family protein n=1 Tax=Prevotella communis TaxID=2913614 RepID=UPI001EDC42B0|nr:fimbrillin family protein [Prevotella communis]UKK63057.1 fimbrillin family protein [Prevotella communis]UKK65882.1 fimbrillin family protein [Prevotella communis]UKK68312.1 fimbrillin family protein [Prevotella communis]UKK69553.1 fimbrillin family protein [Prevotella communis]
MRFKNIFFAAAAAMALTACSSDDAIETVQQKSQFPEDGVMRFTTNLVDPTAVTTRASITGSDVNQNGQQFQVKIVNPTSATYSYFNTVQYDGSEWTPINRMLWQNDQQSITVTAAYKQGKTFSDYEFIVGANLTVAADQSTEAKLKQQDLLTMPTKTIANPSIEETLMQNGKLVINFYHALSKLDVTLDLANEFYKNDPKLNNASDITEFTISGTNAGYQFKAMETVNENYGTVTAAATPVAADILANQSAFTAATETNQHSTATYESIVVPQQIAAGALTVSFKIGTRSFSWTNTEAITLEQGKHYTLPLTVGFDTTTLNARAFTVTSWEDQPGDNLGTE